MFNLTVVLKDLIQELSKIFSEVENLIIAEYQWVVGSYLTPRSCYRRRMGGLFFRTGFKNTPAYAS